MSLYNHYYARAVHEVNAAKGDTETTTRESLFLKTSEEWLSKYNPGLLRAKRVAMFTCMKGAKTA